MRTESHVTGTDSSVEPVYSAVWPGHLEGGRRASVHRVDAEIGVARGTAQLDNGFFRARRDRATPGEQLYMRAMAPDGDEGSASGEVAARLKKNITSLEPTRANLISKGLVYAPEHGVIAFTVPGMAAFIDRQLTE